MDLLALLLRGGGGLYAFWEAHRMSEVTISVFGTEDHEHIFLVPRNDALKNARLSFISNFEMVTPL